jgi:DNA-directed RNA polymerase subunit D
MIDVEKKVGREVEEYKMEMKLISQDKIKTTFLAKGVTPAEVNTIRRITTNKVPTMAMDTIEIIENTSAVYNEMLAHRLGLTVLKTDLKSYFVQADCKCKGEGCARCTLQLSLDVEGPCTVYAEQIKSNDPKVIPAQSKTPLTKLLENQKLKFIATAKLGSGKEHIKFSPGLIYYKGEPNIKVGNVKNAKEVAEVCPKQVYKLDGSKLKVAKQQECILCKACEDASKEIQVTTNNKDFIITIEPWGQLTPQEIVSSAADIISKQAKDVIEAVKKIK